MALAVLGLLPEKIDGRLRDQFQRQSGHDVTYSGTVTAAMEAAIWDLPAIAVSLDVPDEPPGVIDYGPAAGIARQVAAIVSQCFEDILLNVNVPYLSGKEIKGIKLTRQDCASTAICSWCAPTRAAGHYWSDRRPTGVPDEGTDFGALAEGYVSITPSTFDLTSYRALEDLQGWNGSRVISDR